MLSLKIDGNLTSAMAEGKDAIDKTAQVAASNQLRESVLAFQAVSIECGTNFEPIMRQIPGEKDRRIQLEALKARLLSSTTDHDEHRQLTWKRG
jgi:hypothetical protein